MSDGREEREDEAKRRERETWQQREDRVERYDNDQGQPERDDS